MNTATTSGVQHNALGPEAVAIASFDPLPHAPAITGLRPDVSRREILMVILILMLPGMVSDPRRPVHGYWRRAGAATVRRQDIPMLTPHAMDRAFSSTPFSRSTRAASALSHFIERCNVVRFLLSRAFGSAPYSRRTRATPSFLVQCHSKELTACAMQLTQGVAVMQGKLYMLNNVDTIPTSALPQMCSVAIASSQGGDKGICRKFGK